MRESLNRAMNFLSPERRRAKEREQAERTRINEERDRQHKERVEVTNGKFSQLSKEGLFTNKYKVSDLGEKFRSISNSTNGILTLEAVEKQIRQNAGQGDLDIYAWMNSVNAQVRAVESALYEQRITPEIKKEIEEDLFSLYGSVGIMQIQQTLSDKYNIEVARNALGYRSNSPGN